MGVALVPLLLGIALGPAGMPDRFRRPRHQRLAEALGTLEAPVDPGLLPAACSDRGHPRLFLQCGSGGIACALFATGDEKAGGEDRPSAGEGWEEREVRMALGTLRAGGIAGSDGRQGDAQWGSKRLAPQGSGGNDARIGGARCGSLDGVAALCDHVGRAALVVAEESRKGGAARELGRCAGGASDADSHRKCGYLYPETNVAPAGNSCAASW
jgi:hypothetical protein